MWTSHRARTDRLLAAVEIPALGLWVGALVGFAFIQAPTAFRIVAPLDIGKFAALTTANLAALTVLGYVCGGIAIVVAAFRSVEAGERSYDIIRIFLVVAAEVLAFAHQRFIVPAMAQIQDFQSPAYHAMHARSSTVYGVVVLLLIAALVMTAARSEN